jgi:D5-like protein/uncharacterized protein DUF5906
MGPGMTNALLAELVADVPVRVAKASSAVPLGGDAAEERVREIVVTLREDPDFAALWDHITSLRDESQSGYDWAIGVMCRFLANEEIVALMKANRAEHSAHGCDDPKLKRNEYYEQTIANLRAEYPEDDSAVISGPQRDEHGVDDTRSDTEPSRQNPENSRRALEQLQKAKERRQPRAQLTDTGNAERFAEDHHDELLFVPGVDWHQWDGTRWAPDKDRGAAIQAAMRTARGIRDEARAIEDGELAKKVFSHATNSEHRARLEAIVKLAQSDPGLQVMLEELDSNPDLLNVANGTLDLRTGQLRAHDPADRITKLIPIAYDPEARCPAFERFLAEVLDDDPELIAFVQRLIGQALTGHACAYFLLLNGNGCNGKSTLVDLLAELLGDYAVNADPATFTTASLGRAARSDLARLRGARFVRAAELEHDAVLAEVTVKQLTGNDHGAITARFNYQDEIEFKPALTPMLTVNRLPRVQGGL